MCALLGALVVLLLRQGVPREAAPAAASQPEAQMEAETQAEAATDARAVSDLAEKWLGSVAEVSIEYQAGRRYQSVEKGNGSGVYFDSNGYFLTNYHVIEDAVGIRVRLSTGQELAVKGSAFDRTYDVAVLYTGPVGGLAAVEQGDSKALRVGDPVVAVGYPRVGDDVLPDTLTTGVVSGLNRLNVTAGNISPDVGMIQIDAAINAGNSGGALFSMDGKLVGVPTMKIASGDGEESFEGLAFAIPADVVWPIALRLVDEINQKSKDQ
jgi:S1-C subfamily serine protease